MGLRQGLGLELELILKLSVEHALQPVPPKPILRSIHVDESRGCGPAWCIPRVATFYSPFSLTTLFTSVKRIGPLLITSSTNILKPCMRSRVCSPGALSQTWSPLERDPLEHLAARFFPPFATHLQASRGVTSCITFHTKYLQHC